MKILHLNDKLDIRGGVEVYIDQLCRYGKVFEMGMDWKAISKNYKSQYILEGIHFNKQTFETLDNLVKKLQVYCEEQHIDLIHIHSISDPALIRELFKIRPVVRSMHEPRIVCPGQGKFWRKSEQVCTVPFGLHCFYHAYKEGCCNRHPKRLIKAYNNVKFETTEGRQNYKAIIAMSKYMINEAIEAGFQKKQLSFNPYFTEHVDAEKLKDQSAANTKSIIFIGRLSRTKGVHYFIAAGLRLLEEGYNIQLDIVGDGHDAAYFKSLVPAKYRDQFIFHGWQPRENIDRLLHQSYLMVFPSIYPEAFGISGIEAMMRAKPVVGFDVGGVSTWLKDDETGFLVEPKNVEDLTKRIAQLINDKMKYKAFTANARNWAQKEFSVKKHMSVLRDTYQNALKP